MLVFSAEIIDYISKYYTINRDDVRAIVEDEWDYIEQMYIAQESSAQEIAKEIVSLYMVA
jgi:hypothetical protein